MIAVIQRVKKAEVSVDDRIIGRIGNGLLVLLGVAAGDSDTDAAFLAGKVSDLRIFPDSEGKMNISLKDAGGSALVVSQFTLCGDWRKGRRPSFTGAASPDEGERLYTRFCEQLRARAIPVEQGEFGAMMDVALINEGPVTFVLDSKDI